ncbi:MAG: hypothetical protein A2097_02375 [Desulfobacula sp. GWF2_41_7]|nr:MAG: hypothetical protein A2097_02375 [Desulfobacula sp. GWF2_41_7]
MKKTLMILFTGIFFIGNGFANDLRVVSFGADVAGITSLDKSFDPDSYSVITQIFDSLIHIDLNGKRTPALATSWTLIDNNTYEFELRNNVVFHNGEPFNAECVKFTYEWVANPANKAGNAWILNTIQSVEVLTSHKVRIHLKHPDGMFLFRLSMFGAIVPVQYIKRVGLAEFYKNPMGTGPYKFLKWEKGRQIILKKNSEYWEKEIPNYENLFFKIIPENKWVEALKNNEVDVVTNIHPDDITAIESDGRFKTMRRSVLQGYWIMMRFKGPLADVNVRKAMNFAVDKTKMIRVQNGGLGTALASLGKNGEIGKSDRINPYPYDPAKARALLAAAGYANGFKLKVITIDQAEKLSLSIKEDLSKIGIELDLEIVSRPDWAKKVVVGKMTGAPYDGDMAINLVDNPIVDLAFHAGLFLESSSPWSLAVDPEFNKKFQMSLFTSSFPNHVKALSLLDEYIHEQAMMLFTFQPVSVFAMKKEIQLPGIGVNGHIDYNVFSRAK